MKIKNIFSTLSLSALLFVGCTSKQPITEPRITTPATGIQTGTGTSTGTGTGTSTGTGTKIETQNGAGLGAGGVTGTKNADGTYEGEVGINSTAANSGTASNLTFKGDLYISTNNFRLINTKVDGNVYFTTAEAKSTFTMDANSKITGRQEVQH